MTYLTAAQDAHDLLVNKEVAARLGLDPREASRLGLALVTGADAAPDLAAELLAESITRIDEIRRQESCATAEPVYEGDELILHYELTEGTRKCLNLIAALRVIAAKDRSAGRAA
jgi:hypothetical protein